MNLNSQQFIFSDEQLILTCVDFSFPSLSAVPATIAFLFQQMLLEPEVQRKVQKEIDQVVGHGRAPTLDDRVKYVLNPIHRWKIQH